MRFTRTSLLVRLCRLAPGVAVLSFYVHALLQTEYGCTIIAVSYDEIQSLDSG